MLREDIIILEESIDSTDAYRLLSALSASLERITGNSGAASFDVNDMNDPRACFAVARDAENVAVGCGAIRPYDSQTAELKRMYASVPKQGIGKSVLTFLESKAAALGYQIILLETRRINDTAVAFYLANGYRVIPNYGAYAGRAEAICFEKSILPAAQDVTV